METFKVPRNNLLTNIYQNQKHPYSLIIQILHEWCHTVVTSLLWLTLG